MKKVWENPRVNSLDLKLTESGNIEVKEIYRTKDIQVGDGNNVLFYWWCTCCGIESIKRGLGSSNTEGVNYWHSKTEALANGQTTHANCGACSA